MKKGFQNYKIQFFIRVKLLAILIFFQTTMVNALESVVLRTISSPTESRVMLDTTGDGQVDMYVSIPRNKEPLTLYNMITSVFERGVSVDVDDEWIIYDDRNMPFSYIGGVISVNNIGVFGMFPGKGDIFEAAHERAVAERRRQQQNQRGSR